MRTTPPTGRAQLPVPYAGGPSGRRVEAVSPVAASRHEEHPPGRPPLPLLAPLLAQLLGQAASGRADPAAAAAAYRRADEELIPRP
ncbi:MAG TPA: hypothetical protein VGO20_19595 [Arenibaculum sp.]|nr:hypothetical protein [Arenibaculum sp.]